PDIVVYGEPWEGGTSALPENQQADQKNANALNGVGQFNDQMRDALIKGGMKGKTETGWVTNMSTVNSGDVDAIIKGMQGITAGSVAITSPDRTVNYVTCHDNYTLYDRIIATGAVRKSKIDIIKGMAVLANSVVFTSNGTTFMLAGEEFLRTKNVDGATEDEVHNSYESSYKVNELDYSLKITYADVFANYQKLIEFKKTCSGLHLSENEIAGNYTVTQQAGGSVIQVIVKDAENNREYKIIHANGSVKNYTADFAGYTLYWDTLGTTQSLSAATAISAYQTIIAYK
ncbi:MAG: hypothetical protein NC332_04695, partial [Firmicutes bacterium]|nr:hypothetical protein [Bacillota bacterium]